MFLDVYFNKLKGLFLIIGKFLNFIVFDVSSNFRDFVDLLDLIGDLVFLIEFDFSFN